MNKFSKGELTDGPSGSIGLVGHPTPSGNEEITSKSTGSYAEMTGPGGPTEIMSKGGSVLPESFTRPGGNTEI